jgi:hypothetical protein
MNNVVAELKAREVPPHVKMRYPKSFRDAHDMIQIVSKVFDNGDCDAVWLRCFNEQEANEMKAALHAARPDIPCNVTWLEFGKE